MVNRPFRKLMRVEAALRLAFASVETVKGIERVRIERALGRVLARKIVAKKYLPPHDIAVVDGYAVRSIDLRHPSRKPVTLRLVGRSKIGELSRIRLRRGETVAVATGSMMPRGGDAAVMIEDTKMRVGNRVEFRESIKPLEGVTRQGDDLKPGRVVLERGSRLRPEDIGVLKALGLTSVQVVRRVRVAILSTGDELVNKARRGDSAKTVDLNRPILKGMLRELGASVVDLGIVKDDEAAIKGALRRGLSYADLVLVTAGSSVGNSDLVSRCINSLGKPGMIVHGVAMRPAMPTGVAAIGGKPVVSLPGFPVSAVFAFRVFVRPLIAKLVGAPDTHDPTITATLSERIHRIKGGRTFVRVRVRKVRSGYVAVPVAAQRSSILTSIVDANGIVTIPESMSQMDAGTKVWVTLTGAVS